MHDIADRAHGKTREQVLKEMRHGKIDPKKGPKPFGHVGKRYMLKQKYLFLYLIILVSLK